MADNSNQAKAMLRLQYYRSTICTLQQVVEREDTVSIRGMVKAVPHLVRIVE
jgi:large subunit ribosomal protein L30